VTLTTELCSEKEGTMKKQKTMKEKKVRLKQIINSHLSVIRKLAGHRIDKHYNDLKASPFEEIVKCINILVVMMDEDESSASDVAFRKKTRGQVKRAKVGL
jgi:hypothetical protein